MTSGRPKDLAASVRQRLLEKAKVSGKPFNEVLQYYAMERFLYRLSQSHHADSFILKGALLLHVWQGETARATKDIDVLGVGPGGIEAVAERVREVLAQGVSPDGIVFAPETIHAEAIAPEAEYQGVRVRFRGLLGKMRLSLQVDVGIGDVLVPQPSALYYPTILDQPKPRLLSYTPQSMVAEKLHAMIHLGAANSRMKDFFDLRALSESMSFDGVLLFEAISATFRRRETPFPELTPLALTRVFAELPNKGPQWRAFLRNSRLDAPEDLAEVIDHLAGFLWPPLESLRDGTPFHLRWNPGGPWKTS